jgi:hypothetical protein
MRLPQIVQQLMITSRATDELGIRRTMSDQYWRLAPSRLSYQRTLGSRQRPGGIAVWLSPAILLLPEQPASWSRTLIMTIF